MGLGGLCMSGLAGLVWEVFEINLITPMVNAH
jgi:hypothetical protein